MQKIHTFFSFEQILINIVYINHVLLHMLGQMLNNQVINPMCVLLYSNSHGLGVAKFWFCQVLHIDDIIYIFSSIPREHIQHLQKVIERFKQHNF
jgi:hypothetical protein